MAKNCLNLSFSKESFNMKMNHLLSLSELSAKSHKKSTVFPCKYASMPDHQ